MRKRKLVAETVEGNEGEAEGECGNRKSEKSEREIKRRTSEIAEAEVEGGSRRRKLESVLLENMEPEAEAKGLIES